MSALDGPFDGLLVRHIRVLDTTADGLNLHRGVSNVIVEESFFRNNGDDGIASWAEKLANHDIIIRHNTVVAPILANGVAIYGGHDIAVSDNLISDTLTEGGGLHLGNRFGAVPPLLDSSQEAVLLIGKRIDGLVVNGLRVDRAGGSLIELRADGSATLSGVDAAGVLDPAVRTCGAFLLDWKGSNKGFDSSAHGC